MKLNIIKNQKRKEKNDTEKIGPKPKPQSQSQQDQNVLNYTNLKNMLGNSEDIKYRDIVLNNNKEMTIHMITIDGMVNSSDISNYVLKPLIENQKVQDASSLDEIITFMQNGEIYYAGQSSTTDINKITFDIISGGCAIVFDTQNVGFVFDTKGYEKRPMMEPTIENVNKGPRDSFIENYRTNTATIRRKIKVPDLMFEQMTIGDRTKTTVSIVYIKSITNEEIIKLARDRLNTVNTDNVLTTSVIEDVLSDNINSTIPQVVTTERPDKFCADLLEGRVGILIDGVPFGFVIPATFNQFMQTAEDYSRKFVISSFIRVIRYMSLIMATFLPALYVAITTFHPEMIPTNVVLFIAKSREGVAFPVAFETLGLLIAFEILFEAGLRIPKSVGQTVSIVGTLVVGQAAVEAKLVSPSVVVIIAATAIASFTIPNQDFSNFVRLWRIVCTVFGVVLGLLGVVISVILLTFELCKMVSFGVPYMAPFVGNDGNGLLMDTFFRLPSKINTKRPAALKTKDPKRRGD